MRKPIWSTQHRRERVLAKAEPVIATAEKAMLETLPVRDRE